MATCVEHHYRKKQCLDNCAFLPLLPPEMTKEWKYVAAIYKADYLHKILDGTHMGLPQRETAMTNLIWEASLTNNDLVHGSFQYIDYLRNLLRDNNI